MESYVPVGMKSFLDLRSFPFRFAVDVVVVQEVVLALVCRAESSVYRPHLHYQPDDEDGATAVSYLSQAQSFDETYPY